MIIGDRKDFFKNLFYFYFWLCWVFVALRGLSLVAESGDYSSLRCAGFSLRWLLLLRSTGSQCTGFSSCGSRALEHRPTSCGTRAQLLCGMWDLPGPGLEPVSPALAGGFLTTEPPGKPQKGFLYFTNCLKQTDIITRKIILSKKKEIQGAIQRQRIKGQIIENGERHMDIISNLISWQSWNGAQSK